MKLNPKKSKLEPKKFSLKITALLCSLVLSASPVVNAGIMDELMEGVYTNTTSSGAFDSQKMGHYQGGSFYARFPTKPINVAMFDPPRIQAGCGGIDMFGGSFSFISGDEIVQILRSIGQNALGLLFQMGIQAISQPLSTMLSHFSDKLQSMNQALRNSCAAANKLVSLVKDGPTQDQQAAMSSISQTLTGGVADAFSSFAKSAKKGAAGLWGETTKWLRREDQPNATMEDNAQMALRNDPSSGNMTWKAMTNTKAYELFSAGMGSSIHNERQIKELVINIAGTKINNQTEGEDSNKCSSSGGAIPCAASGILDLTSRQFKAEYLKTVPDDIQILTCKDYGNHVHNEINTIKNDMACLQMQRTKLRETFKGAAYYVNKALFGVPTYDILTPEQIKVQITQSKGLVGKGLSSNSQPPTAEEIAILESTSVPFLAHLFYLQVSPPDQQHAITLVYDMMINKYAYMLGQNLVATARAAYGAGSAKPLAEKPERFDENISEFANELAALHVDAKKEIQTNNDLFAIREYVERAASVKAVSNRITSN